MPVKAQEQFSIGIYPTIIEIDATPPAIIESNISIENQSEKQQELNIIIRFFKSGTSSDGQIELAPEGEVYAADPDFLQKIKVIDGIEEVKKITLKPLEAKTLTLEINLERGTPSSDYYFSILFISEGSDALTTSGSEIIGGIGTNVILSVGEKKQTKGEIREFTAPKFVFSAPVPFRLLLRNNSQHYIIPEGNILIKDMFGRNSGRVDILPQYILSNSERFMLDSGQASPSASDHPTLLWHENFLFGIYTATAHVKLAQDGHVFETTTTFIAIPFHILAAISLLSFMLIGIWIKVRSKI